MALHRPSVLLSESPSTVMTVAPGVTTWSCSSAGSLTQQLCCWPCSIWRRHIVPTTTSAAQLTRRGPTAAPMLLAQGGKTPRQHSARSVAGTAEPRHTGLAARTKCRASSPARCRPRACTAAYPCPAGSTSRRRQRCKRWSCAPRMSCWPRGPSRARTGCTARCGC
eukprot:scaffold122850_cov87-Phaeocystis_antarctica.AAC.2